MTYASWGAVGSGTSARAAAPAMSIENRAIVERAPAMRVENPISECCPAIS